MTLKELKNDLYIGLMEKADDGLTEIEVAIGFYLSQDEDIQGILRKGDLCKANTKMRT